MDALYGEGSAGGQRGAVVAARTAWERKVQQFLDQSVPHTGPRWGAFAVVVLFYLLRVYLLQGFYIVTYGIAIFNLNLAIGFLSPAFDPEEQEGPTLPTTEKEFKPFVRRVPEFKFWLNSIKSFLIGFWMTFFPMFDVPVFWPILLMYWIMLFVLTMKRQIKHMIKHRYLPFTRGKQKYTKGGGTPKASAKDSNIGGASLLGPGGTPQPHGRPRNAIGSPPQLRGAYAQTPPRTPATHGTAAGFGSPISPEQQPSPASPRVIVPQLPPPPSPRRPRIPCPTEITPAD